MVSGFRWLKQNLFRCSCRDFSSSKRISRTFWRRSWQKALTWVLRQSNSSFLFLWDSIMFRTSSLLKQEWSVDSWQLWTPQMQQGSETDGCLVVRIRNNFKWNHFLKDGEKGSQLWPILTHCFKMSIFPNSEMYLEGFIRLSEITRISSRPFSYLIALTSAQLSPPSITIASLLLLNRFTSCYSLSRYTEQETSPNTSLSNPCFLFGSDSTLQKRGSTSSTIEVYRLRGILVSSILFLAKLCWSLLMVLVLLERWSSQVTPRAITFLSAFFSSPGNMLRRVQQSLFVSLMQLRHSRASLSLMSMLAMGLRIQSCTSLSSFTLEVFSALQVSPVARLCSSSAHYSNYWALNSFQIISNFSIFDFSSETVRSSSLMLKVSCVPVFSIYSFPFSSSKASGTLSSAVDKCLYRYSSYTEFCISSQLYDPLSLRSLLATIEMLKRSNSKASQEKLWMRGVTVSMLLSSRRKVRSGAWRSKVGDLFLRRTPRQFFISASSAPAILSHILFSAFLQYTRTVLTPCVLATTSTIFLASSDLLRASEALSRLKAAARQGRFKSSRFGAKTRLE